MEIKKTKKKPEQKEVLIAKRDFHIVQNEYDIKIKAGEPIPDLPEAFLVNLKTEQVI